jgi:hypothetical protein
MAGSSSDLHTISQIWLTAYEILSLNLPGMPNTPQGVRKNLNKASLLDPLAIRPKKGVQGKAIEYRADLLPIHAQKALLAMQSDSQAELSPAPVKTTLDFLSDLSIHSHNILFSAPAEMVDDGLNLLSVLNRFIASSGDFVRDDLSRALELAEGLIRAGNSLSKSEGGAA